MCDALSLRLWLMGLLFFVGVIVSYANEKNFAMAADPIHRNGLGMEFTLIPAGFFRMGAVDHDRNASREEKPEHGVRITRPFYLGRFEVTQAQWEAVMGENPYSLERTRSSWNDLIRQPGRFIAPQKPATVSWNDAQSFIKRLNQMEGHNRYRLPTEAEWEYAARAGSEDIYSFGDDYQQLERYAWYGGDFATGSTHPVGRKLPNAWGLHDMQGNVWEWVQDWYEAYYYSNASIDDPAGPPSGSKKVVRGGSWHQTGDGWRLSARRDYPPDYRGISIGFRVVLQLP